MHNRIWFLFCKGRPLPISQIINCVTRTLEKADPELAADLAENGVYLADDGALLGGLDESLGAATGLDIRMVDDALR